MFDQPQTPPEAVNSQGFAQSPIDFVLDFNGRKSQPQGTKGKVSASDLNVCFSYYKRSEQEGEKGQVVTVPAFSFFVFGIYSRFAGTNFNQDKPSESEHYTSTIYRGKNDVAFFRKEYVSKIRENEAYKNHWSVGTYDQLRAFADKQTYREKVGYKKTALCYCIESDSIIEIGINRRMEYGMANAIAVATRTEHNAKRIGGLNLLTTEFWGFSFKGDFHEVTDVKGGECIPISTKGEWGFAPSFVCGVVKQTSTGVVNVNGKQIPLTEIFARCSELQMECDAYVDSQIEWAKQILNGGDEPQSQNDPAEQAAREAAFSAPSRPSAPAQPRAQEAWPAQAPPVDYTNSSADGDDLPF
jgi:hypothetical protein